MSKNCSDAGKKRWANPEYRQAMTALHNTEEYKKYAADRQRKLWSDPEFKEKVRAKQEIAFAKPEYRDKMRALRLNALKDPVFAEKTRLSFKLVNLSRTHEERSTTAKKCWSEERKARHAEEMRRLWADPDFKEKRRATLKSFGQSELAKKQRVLRTTRERCASAVEIVLSESKTVISGLQERLSALATELFGKPELANTTPDGRVAIFNEGSIFDEYGIAAITREFPGIVVTQLLEKSLTLAYRAQAYAKETARDQEKNVRSGLGDSHAAQRSKLERLFQEELENITGLRATHVPALGDIVFEDKRVCIEIDGDVFHAVARHHNSATQPVSPMYHRNRTRAIRAKGYRAIRFWGHEIESRRLQCINFALGALGHGRRIGARKTIVREVGIDEAKRLVDMWHVQALPPHTFLFGAVLEEKSNGRPIAVMTFGKHHRQNTDDNVVCLTRLAFAHDTNVPGGSEKLLTFARNRFLKKGQTVVSWSHERLGTGAVYERLGFTRTATLPPDYHYVGRAGQVFDKQSCQRKTLRKRMTTLGLPWTKDDTEEVLASHLSMSRCYDAGKIKWELLVT